MCIYSILWRYAHNIYILYTVYYGDRLIIYTYYICDVAKGH